MLYDRRLLLVNGHPEVNSMRYFSEIPRNESPDRADDATTQYQYDEWLDLMGAVEVVPVEARGAKAVRKDGVDPWAKIITGDVGEELSLDPFDRSEAEWTGLDKRGTPISSFDDDFSGYL